MPRRSHVSFRYLLLGVFGLLAGCAPVQLLNATVPTGGLRISHAIAYGPEPRQNLDIYRPIAASGPLPVVVFFYGGSWQSGSRGDYLFAAAALARRGLVVVVPDYRLSPQVGYPVFLQDCARAVVWAQHNASNYGGDPAKLFLMGHSAGAYNALMLALDPQLLRQAGGSNLAIAGTIGLAGPYDFLPLTAPDIQRVFAPAAPDLAETQPITYAGEPHKPILLLAGSADHTVSPRNTTRLAAALAADHGPDDGAVESRIYPGIGHIGLILTATPLFSGRAPMLKDVMGFIQAHG